MPRPKQGVKANPKWSEETGQKVIKLAWLGLTTAQIAEAVDVHRKTIDLWVATKPEFAKAFYDGKNAADDKVKMSLYRRACGYSFDAVKIFADPKTGSHQIIEYVEHVPPDTTACIFWLKNRQPAEWRDVSRLEHTGKNGEPFTVVVSSVLDRDLPKEFIDVKPERTTGGAGFPPALLDRPASER